MISSWLSRLDAWIFGERDSAHVTVSWPTRAPWPPHFDAQHRVLQWLYEMRIASERELLQKGPSR